MRSVHASRIPFLLNSDETRLFGHVLGCFVGCQGGRLLRCLDGPRLLDRREGPLGDGFLNWLGIRELVSHCDDLLEVQLIHQEVLLLLRQRVQVGSQGEWLRF